MRDWSGEKRPKVALLPQQVQRLLIWILQFQTWSFRAFSSPRLVGLAFCLSLWGGRSAKSQVSRSFFSLKIYFNSTEGIDTLPHVFLGKEETHICWVAVPTVSSHYHLGSWVLLESVSHSVISNSVTPWTVAHQAPLPWNSPGKNTGVGSHSLLQEIFPTQGSNPGLLHCR